MNVTVVHAHPDDELLWAGALMLAQRDWRWTLVSLTGGLRLMAYEQNLVTALAKYGVTATAWNMEYDDTPDFDAAEWEVTIATLPRPDLVVSHGAGGEYGHPHHVAVHNAVHRTFAEVWDFAAEGGITVPVTADKSALFREVYGGAVLAELRADKAALFREVYGGAVLAELHADKPALIDRLFAREHFRPWQRAA